jgi:hypothetical protein
MKEGGGFTSRPKSSMLVGRPVPMMVAGRMLLAVDGRIEILAPYRLHKGAFDLESGGTKGAELG